MVSTSGSSGTGFWDLDVDDTVADFDWVNRKGGAGVVRALAGGGVELPGVPGAYDQSVKEIALGEGSSRMGTQSLDCTDFAIVVAEQDREFFVLPGGHRARWELDE